MQKPMQDTAKTNLAALNEKQREAVVSEARRVLVLAGAGSGKTKTLLQKMTEKGRESSFIKEIPEI